MNFYHLHLDKISFIICAKLNLKLKRDFIKGLAWILSFNSEKNKQSNTFNDLKAPFKLTSLSTYN